MKRFVKTYGLISLAAFLLILNYSCAPFRDSPFSDELLRSERDLNTASLSEIAQIEADFKVRIAIFTDSHQNYKDLDETIYSINRTTELDFVVNLGDFTNSGYSIEYDQFLDSYVNLLYPTFSVPGNHDMLGSGPALFQKVFGPNNFWFESDQFRYVFFQSNNLEDPEGFSPAWLLDVVNNSTKKIIIFSHLKLIDSERFSGETAQFFTDVIQHPSVKLILNGHNHVYNLENVSGTVLLQGPRLEGNNWLILEIVNNDLKIIKQPSGETVFDTLKP